MSTGKELCSLVSYAGGTWAVTDPEGRFDGSNAGAVKGLHWVYDDPKHNRMEPNELSQFANLYYTPGLLAKIWKGEKLPPVPKLQEVSLYPEVKGLKVAGSHVRAALADRGGGFGEVHVIVNGVDVKTVPGAARLNIDLSDKLKGLANPDVRLYAYNAQGTIRSRATGATDSPETLVTKATPKIVAVVGSVQHYANPTLELAYSDADAIAVTKALLSMAKGLGAKIQVEMVCDDPKAQKLGVRVHAADKAGFEAAFASASKAADAGSVYVVYLSGHGVALAKDGGKSNEFFYLTRDARDGSSVSMGNPDVARQWAVSGSEIRGYLERALACRRRFVVLDTCSAGASRGSILTLKGDAEDAARARREFQQGTGTFALMGAAEGKASLEAAEYGHGLLTYALLETLKNRKLGGNESPDMVLAAALVAQAKAATSALARDLGRGQEPVAVAPEAGTVVLGRMDDLARASIALTSRLPLLARPVLVDADSTDDALARELAERLRELSLRRRDGPGDLPFAGYQEEAVESAYQLKGTYTVSGDTVTVKARVWRGGKAEDRPFPTVTVPRAETASRLAEALRTWLAGAKKTP